MSLRPRAFEMLRSMTDRGEQPGRWRCSPDMGTELQLLVSVVAVQPGQAGDPGPVPIYVLRGAWGGYPAGYSVVGPTVELLGLPVHVDEALPPNSLVLEAAV